jgi:hypothetical protein
MGREARLFLCTTGERERLPPKEEGPRPCDHPQTLTQGMDLWNFGQTGEAPDTMEVCAVHTLAR